MKRKTRECNEKNHRSMTTLAHSLPSSDRIRLVIRSMSYPMQLYNPNNRALVNPSGDRSIFSGNSNVTGGDVLDSIFGLANQLMAEMLRSGPMPGDLSSIIGSDPNNPHVQVFGISAMNVTQISPGPGGRPHIIQAHDERRIGPGGVWQSKRAVRDSDRGIDKIQIGRFDGEAEQIIEHEFQSPMGQYQQDTNRRSLPTNQPQFSARPQIQGQTHAQRPALLPTPSTYQTQQQQQQPYRYYPQQYPPRTQLAPPSYRYY